MHETTNAVDALVKRLRRADEDTRVSVRAELLALLQGPNGADARDQIQNSMKGELLEVQWELEELLEETAPPPPTPTEPEPAPEPEPEPEPEDPDRALTASDLNLVYDDPRGLMLHKSKVGNRWFATQVDPRTGTPQTFELHASEIDQIKGRLDGSPYWVVGA